MAAGAQQFCLKWNNYHVNIASSFDSLRVDEDFVDVTLACSGCQLKAHRMVLSACSPFFRQLLKSNPHPHPIIILRDVSQYNMELLLDFMYHGEVNVAQEQLPEFLKVAELLKVKGLADEKREEAARAGPNGQSGGSRTPSSSPAPVIVPPSTPAPDESPPPPPIKRHRPMPLPGLLHHPPPQAAAAPAAPPLHPPPPVTGTGTGYMDQTPVKREPGGDSEGVDYSTPEPPRIGGGGVEERVRVLHQTGLSSEEAAMLVPAEVTMEEAEQSLPPEASRGQTVGPGPSTGPHEASTDPLMRLLAAADQQAGTGITLPSGVTLSALGVSPGTPHRPACAQQSGQQPGQLGQQLGPQQQQQMMMMNERRSFPCFICGKEFGYPHHMRRHVETVHTLYPSYVFCPECGRVYKNKNSLSVHMSMYHNSQRRAAQREQALQAQAAAQAHAQATAAGAVWPPDGQALAAAAARSPWPAE